MANNENIDVEIVNEEIEESHRRYDPDSTDPNVLNGTYVPVNVVAEMEGKSLQAIYSRWNRNKGQKTADGRPICCELVINGGSRKCFLTETLNQTGSSQRNSNPDINEAHFQQMKTELEELKHTNETQQTTINQMQLAAAQFKGQLEERNRALQVELDRVTRENEELKAHIKDQNEQIVKMLKNVDQKLDQSLSGAQQEPEKPLDPTVVLQQQMNQQNEQIQKLIKENEDLRERVTKKKGFFARLFGGD